MQVAPQEKYILSYRKNDRAGFFYADSDSFRTTQTAGQAMAKGISTRRAYPDNKRNLKQCFT